MAGAPAVAPVPPRRAAERFVGGGNAQGICTASGGAERIPHGRLRRRDSSRIGPGLLREHGKHDLNKPVVGMAAVPGQTATGWWPRTGECSRTGGAGFYGSNRVSHPQRTGRGHGGHPTQRVLGWSRPDGGIFSYGDAPFYGSAATVPGRHRRDGGLTRRPRLLGGEHDGRIFNYGDAALRRYTSAAPQRPHCGHHPRPGDRRHCSWAPTGRLRLRSALLRLDGSIHLKPAWWRCSPPATGTAYWFVACDGGVFSYGDAPFRGSMAAPLNRPMVGMDGF